METKPNGQDKSQQVTENLGHNKQYTEYKLDIETKMKTENGAQVFSMHIADVGKETRKCRVEPHRAERLNRNWHTRRFILIESSKPKPEKIKRRYSTFDEREETGAEWHDEFIFETAKR